MHTHLRIRKVVAMLKHAKAMKKVTIPLVYPEEQISAILMKIYNLKMFDFKL